MRSKTLTDYLEMRVLPRIHAGIQRTEEEEEDLQEAKKGFDLLKSDHFPLMMKSPNDLPSAEGYQYRSHGLWVAPGLDHIMYRSSGEKKVFPVHEFSKVNAYAVDRGNKFLDEVRAATKSLAPEYGMYEKGHLSVMHAYTGDTKVNHKLTKGSRLSPEEHKMIEGLDEAVHVHTAPHAFTVFSGISPEHAALVSHNDKVHHPAYLSTSLSPHVAASFSRFKPTNKDEGIEGHMLKIHVPHGHPGAYVGHINPTMEEHELILPRDTVLNIDHSKRLYAPIPHSDGKSYFTIHHATIEPRK